MSKIMHIDQNQFENEVLNSKEVIVDFYSTECPPCEALAPKFEYFSSIYGDKIKFIKIFRQENKTLAEKLGVRSSPTLLFYKNGKEISQRLNGAVKKKDIKNTILNEYKMPDLTGKTDRKTTNYDVAIIGGGPAGLTAALYASRAKLKTIVIDKSNPGGYVNITHSVANYPGTKEEIKGFMLGHYMTEQARNSSAEILMAGDIEEIDLIKKEIKVDDDKLIKSKAIIIATGSKPRLLNIPGEEKFAGNGISYCATCDGNFYEGKNIFVIGGGNSAVEEALYLTKFVNSLTIIHQFDEFQANKTSALEALNNPKIKVLWSHEPRAFIGEDKFEKLEVENLKTKERLVLDGRDGVFIFIGYIPQTEIFGNAINKDKYGCIITDENMATNIPGVFAAGDIRNKKYRQITTAVSDGTIAALEAEHYLKNLK